MAEIRSVDQSTIDWDIHNVLYRGNTQDNFEAKILRSFAQGKPTYYGFTTEGQNRTYVAPSLFQVLIHTGGKSLRDIGKTRDFLTKYPLVMYIRAEKYLDKLRESGPGEGEGIFIEGEIDAEDIFVLLSSECDKVLEQIDRWHAQDRDCVSSYEILLNDIRSRRIDKSNSLIKRFERQQDVMSDLEMICFGFRETPCTPEEQRKIAEAMEYLKRKLEGK